MNGFRIKLLHLRSNNSVASLSILRPLESKTLMSGLIVDTEHYKVNKHDVRISETPIDFLCLPEVGDFVLEAVLKLFDDPILALFHCRNALHGYLNTLHCPLDMLLVPCLAYCFKKPLFSCSYFSQKTQVFSLPHSSQSSTHYF